MDEGARGALRERMDRSLARAHARELLHGAGPERQRQLIARSIDGELVLRVLPGLDRGLPGGADDDADRPGQPQGLPGELTGTRVALSDPPIQRGRGMQRPLDESSARAGV